jgi:putative polyhydroxyalkanoate system protein
MATIDIRRAHTLTLAEAKQRAEQLAKSLEGKLDLSWQWEGDALRFHAVGGAAKGTKGEVAVTGSEIRVQVDLPFMLRVMKGTIEQKVEEKLQALL